MRHSDELISVIIPRGYTNIKVTIGNHLIGNTNNRNNWDTFKIPLPNGPWSIYSVHGKLVLLKRQQHHSFDNNPCGEVPINNNNTKECVSFVYNKIIFK